MDDQTAVTHVVFGPKPGVTIKQEAPAAQAGSSSRSSTGGSGCPSRQLVLSYLAFGAHAWAPGMLRGRASGGVGDADGTEKGWKPGRKGQGLT